MITRRLTASILRRLCKVAVRVNRHMLLSLVNYWVSEFPGY